MGSVFGNNVKLSVFGESHGTAIGVVIDGFPAGVMIDRKFIREQMARRAPFGNSLATERQERDEVQILSGVYEGRTTGAPICAMIVNENANPADYADMASFIRPSHADYTGSARFNGYNDVRGGGHFSGRLTAPLMFAGALCRLALENSEIHIVSHIAQIGEVEDEPMDGMHLSYQDIDELEGNTLPTLSREAGTRMKEMIEYARRSKDSLGGIVETCVLGTPVGLGNPMFDGVENRLSSALFAIPGMKGIEFGLGFGFADLYGSEVNDEPCLREGRIETKTNRNGGILGGITNGMPIQFRTVFKPTPSIGMMQSTVDMDTMTEQDFMVQGRHDPCIVPRALPVVEALTAYVLLDYLMQKEGYPTKE